MYFAFSHIITIDPFFSLLISASLLCVLGALKSSSALSCRLFMYGAASICALAVLTKGLVAFFLPGLIIFLWVCFFSQWRRLKNLFLLSSGFIFIIIVLPWHILVAMKNPEFFDFYIIQEQFLRYFTPIHRRSQPFWFFLPVFLVGLFPWVIYLPQSLLRIWQRKTLDRSYFSTDIFLLFWIGATLLFFSFSHSKLIPYILPVMIPTSLLIGASFSFAPKVHRFSFFLPAPLLIYSCLAFVISILLCGASSFSNAVSLHLPPDLVLPLKICSLFLWGPVIVYYLLPFIFSKPSSKRQPISLIVGTIPLLIFLSFMARFIPYNTSANLAHFINTSLPNTPIYLYHTYPQDLPVYLNRSTPLPVVEWKGELNFGTQHTVSPWMMTDAFFSSMLTAAISQAKCDPIAPLPLLCVVVKKAAQPEFVRKHPQCALMLYGSMSQTSDQSDYCLMCTEPAYPT